MHGIPGAQMLEKGGGFAIGIFPEGLLLSWDVSMHLSCIYLFSLETETTKEKKKSAFLGPNPNPN